MTLVALAGLADDRPVRGGLIAGIASAVSVAIGMEMIVYLAATGGVIALRWVAHDGEARRMQAYALGLSGGVSIGRSEEHTSELQSLMRISYAVFCLKKKKDVKT